MPVNLVDRLNPIFPGTIIDTDRIGPISGLTLAQQLAAIRTMLSQIPTGGGQFTNPQVALLQDFASHYRGAHPETTVRLADGFLRAWDWRSSSSQYAGTGITLDDDTANRVTVSGMSGGDQQLNRILSTIITPDDAPTADTILAWFGSADTGTPIYRYTTGRKFQVNIHTPARTARMTDDNFTRLTAGGTAPENENSDDRIIGNDQVVGIVITEPETGDTVNTRHLNIQISRVVQGQMTVTATQTGFNASDSLFPASVGQTAWEDWDFWNDGTYRFWIQIRYKRTASQRVVEFQIADPDSTTRPRPPLSASQVFGNSSSYLQITATRQYENVTHASTMPAMDRWQDINAGAGDVTGTGLLVQWERIGISEYSWRGVPLIRNAAGTRTECNDFNTGDFHDLSSLTFNSEICRMAGIEDETLQDSLRHAELDALWRDHYDEMWVSGLAFLQTVRERYLFGDQAEFENRPVLGTDQFALLSDITAGVTGNTQSYLIAESNELSPLSGGTDNYVQMNVEERTPQDSSIDPEPGDAVIGGRKAFRYDRSRQYRVQILALDPDNINQEIGSRILDGRFFTRTNQNLRAVGDTPFDTSIGTAVTLPNGTFGTVSSAFTTDNVPLFALSQTVRAWANMPQHELVVYIFLEATAERHSRAEVVGIIDQEIPDERRVPVPVNPDGTKYLDDEGNYTVPAGGGGGGGTTLPTATEGQIWIADDKGVPQAADFPTFIESVESTVSADGATHTIDLSTTANRGINTLRLTGTFATRTRLNITALPQDGIFYVFNQNRGAGDFLINAGNTSNAILPAGKNTILRITMRANNLGGQIEVLGFFTETPQEYTVRTTVPQAADGRDGDITEVVADGTKTGYQKVNGVWVSRGSYSLGGGGTEDFDDYNPYTVITSVTMPTPDSYNAIIMSTAAVSPAVLTIPSSAYGRRFIVTNPNSTHTLTVSGASSQLFAAGESGIAAVDSAGRVTRINMLPASILTRLSALEARPSPTVYIEDDTLSLNNAGDRTVTLAEFNLLQTIRFRGTTRLVVLPQLPVGDNRRYHVLADGTLSEQIVRGTGDRANEVVFPAGSGGYVFVNSRGLQSFFSISHAPLTTAAGAATDATSVAEIAARTPFKRAVTSP